MKAGAQPYVASFVVLVGTGLSPFDLPSPPTIRNAEPNRWEARPALFVSVLQEPLDPTVSHRRAGCVVLCRWRGSGGGIMRRKQGGRLAVMFGAFRSLDGTRWYRRCGCSFRRVSVVRDSPCPPRLVASRFQLAFTWFLLCLSFNGILIIAGFILVVEEGEPFLFLLCPFLSR